MRSIKVIWFGWGVTNKEQTKKKSLYLNGNAKKKGNLKIKESDHIYHNRNKHKKDSFLKS